MLISLMDSQAALIRIQLQVEICLGHSADNVLQVIVRKCFAFIDISIILQLILHT